MRLIAMVLLLAVAACGKDVTPGSAQDKSDEGKAIRKAVADVDAAHAEAGAPAK